MSMNQNFKMKSNLNQDLITLEGVEGSQMKGCGRLEGSQNMESNIWLKYLDKLVR